MRRDRICGKQLTRNTEFLRFGHLWIKLTRCSISLFHKEHMHMDAHTPCSIEDQLLLVSPFMKASKRAKAVLASCRSSACYCYHHCPSSCSADSHAAHLCKLLFRRKALAEGVEHLKHVQSPRSILLVDPILDIREATNRAERIPTIPISCWGVQG